MSKVTIIIPAYNCEEWIGRCLDSILNQTYQDFDILVINDGSSDGTDDVSRKYAADYPKKIKYVKQKNMGVAKTRNKAINMAEGKYVTFVDCDDFVDSDYIERLLPRDGEDIVMSGYKRPNTEGKIIREVHLEKEYFSKFVVPAPWAKIYRKDFLTKNKIEFLDNNIGEDVYFNLIATLSTERIRIEDYVGYNWFFNEKSVSNTKQKNFKNLDVMKLLDSSYDELLERGLVQKNYQELKLFYYRYMVWFLLFSSKGASFSEIKEEKKRLFGWLKKRFPGYQKNKLLKGTLPGEIKSTRLAYKAFGVLSKMHLDDISVWLYSKV